VIEAFQRLRSPEQVQGNLMVWIASGGLLVNLAACGVLAGGRSDDLNMRGVWLHVLADAAGQRRSDPRGRARLDARLALGGMR